MKAYTKRYYSVIEVVKKDNLIFTFNYLSDKLMKVIDYCSKEQDREDVICCEWKFFCETSSKIAQATLDNKVKTDEQFLLFNS